MSNRPRSSGPCGGVVGELDGLTKHGAGFRDSSGPKPLEDLCAQAFEARLLCKDVEGRQRKLLQLLREVWGEDSSRRYRAGVDPHYPVDKLRVSVHDEADGSVSPTVGDENCRLITVLSNGAQDCFGLGVEVFGRTLRIVRVETGQCHRYGTKVVGFQVFKNFIPSQAPSQWPAMRMMVGLLIAVVMSRLSQPYGQWCVTIYVMNLPGSEQ